MDSKIFLVFTVLILITGCSAKMFDTEKYEVIYNGIENTQRNEQIDRKNDYTVAMIPKVEGIPYFNAAQEGALEAGEDLGIHVIYKGPIITDWKQQEELIENFVEMKVDAIAISAIDPVKLGPVLQKAKLNGIKILTWDSDTKPEDRELHISMVDPELLGRHIVDKLAASIGEKGEFGILTDSLEAANTNQWIQWMKVHQLEYYPNMTLLEVVETNDNPNRAYKAAIEMIKEHPHMKGIIGSSSVGPPAASQALKDLEKVGEIKVVGLSTPNLMRSYIKDGTAEMITLWSPKKLGYLTVSVMLHILEGKQIVDNQRIANVGVIKMENDTIIMGPPIDITKENIDEYDF
ncbi:autoinducer 2 ABC transporter substrate-binding protein [Bacillus sp. PS06]|uniref:autoinducer 2 ABC transporter substrate-binding protein n=1 Tax=Bacillus sp. PS06 TaxID=2764176 RepID=UPI0017868CD7|nr:autoinducer 2 ABC transporter substrate-binding protein [Bacillus sp. PS06]MBD8068670.1 autoinducer 2 ABC transporter substrate-binding protein [Bacillus sp. PS06]